MKRGATLAPFAILAALLALSAPPWPDDWDGLGFLASETRFDMDRFAPHPPGYPVYVALLQVVHAAVRSPIVAASLVAVASGVAAAALLADAARRALSPGARVPVMIAALTTPLAWRAASAVGSEAPALAFAALAAWGLAAIPALGRRASLTVGIAVGLGLGVRLSWGPLYLPMLLLVPRGHRRAAWLAATACVAAWAAPLLAFVGPMHTVALFRTHFAGHAERWGGTAITEPGFGRLALLARDVFVDGLGAGVDPLGLAIAGALVLLALTALAAWRAQGWRGARAAALVLLPYLAWIAVGQNLRQQPRHALPLVVAFALGLALAATTGKRALALGVTLAALVGARTSLDAYARRTTPPAGAQIVAYARALPSPRRAAFFGGPTARFFEPTELADRAATCSSLGEVLVVLGRMNDLPSRVFVTSELEGKTEARPPLAETATFCRPPRIDRRAQCVTLYEWRLPYLP
jgi:hypothetical protein